MSVFRTAVYQDIELVGTIDVGVPLSVIVPVPVSMWKVHPPQVLAPWPATAAGSWLSSGPYGIPHSVRLQACGGRRGGGGGTCCGQCGPRGGSESLHFGFRPGIACAMAPHRYARRTGQRTQGPYSWPMQYSVWARSI